MRTFRLAPGLLMGLLLTACVTINVYFPAVAAERAADRIIQDVWGDQPPRPPADAGEPSSALPPEARFGALAYRALELLVPPAAAQQADIDISSPAIRKLTAAMEARHGQLKPYYDSGAIGLTGDGLIDVRDQAAVPLPERNRVRKLVADENADRNALYREIAVANQHPEWEGQIRATFARRWVSNAAAGWWYQDSGAWRQK